jgi:hypothetical protein
MGAESKDPETVSFAMPLQGVLFETSRGTFYPLMNTFKFVLDPDPLTS